jgi:lipopolysaccharide/colanic/teichoic acid biosynthesis glycosyltransferase
MRKRAFDILVAGIGLAISSPLVIIAMILISFQDGKPPIYWAERIGKRGKPFRMAKLRTMIWNADASGVDSTSADDSRVTRFGRILRHFKIDELPQLWNVLIGDMSIVGPRPNVLRETNLYTEKERVLLSVCPGLTDLASIVYADLGEILRGSRDPNILYNQLVRPRKSRLGIFYVEKQSFGLDIMIVLLTALSFVSRSSALAIIGRIITRLNADGILVAAVDRSLPLVPLPPPGSDEIVTSRVPVRPPTGYITP